MIEGLRTVLDGVLDQRLGYLYPGKTIFGRNMMPLQEVFLERHIGTDRILAIKTYDRHFAREAFCQMDDSAMSTLAESLNLEETYFEDDIPSINTPEFPEFLWEALLEEAREDGPLFSFFVVYREAASSRKNLIVTPDWPTAESFASRL